MELVQEDATSNSGDALKPFIALASIGGLCLCLQGQASCCPKDTLNTAKLADELYEYLVSIGDEPLNVILLYKSELGEFPASDDDLEGFIESRNLRVDRALWQYSTVWKSGETCVLRVLVDEFNEVHFRLDDGYEIVTALAMLYLNSSSGVKSPTALLSGELTEGRLRVGTTVRLVPPFKRTQKSVMRLSEEDRRRILGHAE